MSGFSATESSPDIEYLNSSTAKIIENILIDLGGKQEIVIFGLCGGRSVGAIFELLSRNTVIPWPKVHFFMVDERLVPITDPESNFKLANDILFEPLKQQGLITDQNCHPFILDKLEPDFGVKKYSDELAGFGGKFDLVILSGGEDGHIGALYPDHHSFDNDAEYYIYMTDSPKPPPERMSASRKLLLRIERAILLVMDESKADLFRRLSDESIAPRDCPAKLVTQLPVSYLITTHQ